MVKSDVTEGNLCVIKANKSIKHMAIVDKSILYVLRFGLTPKTMSNTIYKKLISLQLLSEFDYSLSHSHF